MRPIVTALTSGEHGVVLQGPPGVGDLHAYRVVDEHGGDPGICSVWELTAEERQAIADGRNLALIVFGRPPPMALQLAEPDELGIGEDDPEVRRRLDELR